MPVLPLASTMFPEGKEDRERVERVTVRYMLLMEDADDAVEQHISRYVPPERTKTWGPPDVSRNALAHVARALSTPGHYSVAPTLTGPSADRLQTMMAPLWPKKQHAQYLATGLGAVAVLTDLDPDTGQVVFAVVPPHELWAEPSPKDPTTPVVMRRLQVWTHPVEGPVYVWAEWDVRDPEAPSFRWLRARDGGDLGEDVTVDLTGGDALLGIDYYWRDADGAPFLPWSIHRFRDDGSMWNYRIGRAATIGTFNAMLTSTFALKVARDGTGKATIVSGMTPNPSYVKMATDGSGVASVTIEPGDVLYHSSNPDEQQLVAPIGGAEDLPILAAFSDRYDSRVASDLGAVSSDVVRVGANPISGTALEGMQEAKRAEQDRATPFCSAADMTSIRHAAWLAGVDPTGIGITYARVPKAADALRQEQERDAFELDRGLASPVDVYMRRHPGLTRDQATRELLRIREERALLADLTSDPTVTP